MTIPRLVIVLLAIEQGGWNQINDRLDQLGRTLAGKQGAR
jgi:hypothetical protein